MYVSGEQQFSEIARNVYVEAEQDGVIEHLYDVAARSSLTEDEKEQFGELFGLLVSPERSCEHLTEEARDDLIRLVKKMDASHMVRHCSRAVGCCAQRRWELRIQPDEIVEAVKESIDKQKSRLIDNEITKIAIGIFKDSTGEDLAVYVEGGNPEGENYHGFPHYGGFIGVMHLPYPGDLNGFYVTANPDTLTDLQVVYEK